MGGTDRMDIFKRKIYSLACLLGFQDRVNWVRLGPLSWGLNVINPGIYQFVINPH